MPFAGTEGGLEGEVPVLNRGGDRDANAALHMIAVNRLANGHEPTVNHVRKRTRGRRRQGSATSP